MAWVTVSTKVKKELLEKARKYNINISEVLRNALEEEVRKKEEEEAKQSANKISKSLNISKDKIVELIREIRNEN